MELGWGNGQERRRLRIWLWATVTAMSFALLVLVAGTLHYSAQGDQASREMNRQLELNARIRQLQMVLSALADAETAQRGYLLTGKPVYLQPYLKARDELPRLLEALRPHPVDTPDIAGRVGGIRKLADLKLAEMAEAIRLRETGQLTAALDLLNTRRLELHVAGPQRTGPRPGHPPCGP
ncbi:hypothetical protein CDN99_15755 [Roseateles aquatilis]|uniref:CHASE3 domain-containing protein n=1 Tax=Roseateles aquatilis TaxID=431061 RepID=A0A246J8Q5_9BURK|nr:CHASE3 domain-containing protein [Roseateles aquatilis]MBY0365375.1 CHASE3 domain-containing protein [Burkholderiaceae bacterium]OWQ88923.1 hypothetical protein CDN99_15755 [Roseateles aquatilis]